MWRPTTFCDPSCVFALSQVSKYRFDELFNTQGGESGLSKLEAQVFAQLVSSAPDSPSLKDYGIEPLVAGISSIKLPESASKAVFDAMAQRRLSIAAESTSTGAAEAEKIKSEATSDANKILTFAEGRARAIRGLGEAEAAQYLKKQAEDPELAIYLKNLEFMREAAAGKITLVLPQSLPGMGLFAFDALKGVPSGQVPGLAPMITPAAGKPSTTLTPAEIDAIIERLQAEKKGQEVAGGTK